MDKNKFYITTAIDYVNDTIHIGHAFQKVAADVLARYYRLTLGKDNVFFLTGTDEYGKKAQTAAEKKGLSPQAFVKEVSDSDQKEQDSLNISYDRFIRTTDSDHAKVVQEIWNRVKDAGKIYPGEYTGLYCEGCEAYYTENELVDGKCPIHPTGEIKTVTETNYFFKWSYYKRFLTDHIKNNSDFIYPHHRANEMLEFVKNIQDIPISRKDFTWGVPVPGDQEQVVYVWFDALTNYLTGVGFLENDELFKKFWPADIHILGKDNLRWHALLWPAILKATNIELPKTILVNGFLNIDGQKISKSLGNVIKPTDLVQKYGADAVRYYLLRYTNITEDSDISEEKIKQAYNADLANGLGNLVARVAKLHEKISSKYLIKDNVKLSDMTELYLKEYRFHEALSNIWSQINTTNGIISGEEPWKISDEEKLKDRLNSYVASIIQIAIDLQPFLPETSEKILNQFKKEKITSSEALFPRI